MLQPHLASSDFERWPFQAIKFVWGCCPSTKFAFLESLSSGFGGFQRPCLRQEPAHGTGRSSDGLCAGEAVGRTREDFPAWACQVSSGKERAEVDVAHFSKACESAINCSVRMLTTCFPQALEVEIPELRKSVGEQCHAWE